MLGDIFTVDSVSSLTDRAKWRVAVWAGGALTLGTLNSYRSISGDCCPWMSAQRREDLMELGNLSWCFQCWARG